MANHADQRNFITHEFAAELVRRTASVLGDHADLIPVKGVLLARLYYDDVCERGMTDVDLVLHRMPLTLALTKLSKAGFEKHGWSSDLGVVTLRHPSVSGLALDLHARPLPRGIGAMSTKWLLDGASVDTELFGVRVLVPTRARLLTHTLGVIANDDVYRAHAHTLEDVRRLAREDMATSDAQTIVDAQLKIAASLALGRINEEAPSRPASALSAALSLKPAERLVAERLRAELVRLGKSPVRSLRAKILSRLVGDTMVLRGSALAFATLGRAQAKLLNRH